MLWIILRSKKSVMTLLCSLFRNVCPALALSAIILLPGANIAQARLDRHAVKLVQHGKTIEVTIHGKPFTTYHFADDFILPNTRPFFWPVLADDGTEVTIDHAQHPPLHAWQRSIWIGAGDVNGADQWSFKAKPIPKQSHVRFNKVARDGFREELIWGDKADQPMLREIRTVRFLAYSDGSRGMNICIALTPIAGDVTFFDHRDHGILSVRPTPAIAEAPHFTSDDGSDQCNERTQWCDESGSIDGKTYGIAIFDDPRKSTSPAAVACGSQRQARHRYFSDTSRSTQTRSQPQSSETLRLQSGKTVNFRYGIVIHSGNAMRQGSRKSTSILSLPSREVAGQRRGYMRTNRCRSFLAAVILCGARRWLLRLFLHKRE